MTYHSDGFTALGDPTRREIFERVALSEELIEFLTLIAYEYLD